MARFSAQVEAQALLAKFKRLDDGMKAEARAVVKDYTEKVEAELKQSLDKPVGRSGRGGIKRSRPGQPPRKDTGRLQASIKSEIKGGGMAGVVSSNATDAQGRRYPFMLESGTATIKKRPAFKKAKRKFAKPFRSAVVAAMQKAVQRADR